MADGDRILDDLEQKNTSEFYLESIKLAFDNKAAQDDLQAVLDAADRIAKFVMTGITDP